MLEDVKYLCELPADLTSRVPIIRRAGYHSTMYSPIYRAYWYYEKIVCAVSEIDKTCHISTGRLRTETIGNVLNCYKDYYSNLKYKIVNEGHKVLSNSLVYTNKYPVSYLISYHTRLMGRVLPISMELPEYFSIDMKDEVLKDIYVTCLSKSYYYSKMCMKCPFSIKSSDREAVCGFLKEAINYSELMAQTRKKKFIV